MDVHPQPWENYYFSLCVKLIVFQFVLAGSIASESVRIPTVAGTNAGMLWNPNGSITYLFKDVQRTGYFMVNNAQNKYWPLQTGPEFDRYSPYWIAGEFSPFFSDTVTRETPFNLIHLYHSIFIRYVPNYKMDKNHNFFQFAFVPDWQSWMWITAETGRDSLEFVENDLLRYIVRMDHDENSIDIWVKNLRTNQLVYGQSDNHDYPNRPPTYLSLPIREIYIGSGSHGNYYGEEEIGRKRETFWGTIEETIIGQGKLSSSDVSNWLESGRVDIPTGSVLLDQTQIQRETLLPLTNWYMEKGNLLYFGAENWLWTDERHTLHVRADIVTFKIEKYIHKDDLVNRKYLSFAVITENILQFGFQVKIINDAGQYIWLMFSPRYSQVSYVDSTMEIPIHLRENEWRVFEVNLYSTMAVAGFNVGNEFYVEEIKVLGDCNIADILLTTSPYLVNNRDDELFTGFNDRSGSVIYKTETAIGIGNLFYGPDQTKDVAAITSGDFDGNGDWELITCFNTDSGYKIYKSESGVNMGDHILDKSVSQKISSITAGDYNGNGKDELVIGYNSDMGSGAVKIDLDENTEVPIMALDAERELASMTSGDFDGDGLEELVIGFNTSDGYELFKNNSGQDQGEPLLQLTSNSRSITALAAGDFEGDGKDILIIGAYSDTNSIIVVVEFDKYSEMIIETTDLSRNISALVMGDFNGDGDEELVIGINTSEGYELFMSELGHEIEGPVFQASSSRKISVLSAGDFSISLYNNEDYVKITNESLLSSTFLLMNNFPNPFNHYTTIRYTVPETGNISLIIYDLRGRKIRTLIHSVRPVGHTSMQWDGRDDYGKSVSSGMYLYQIQAGIYSKTQKMILLK